MNRDQFLKERMAGIGGSDAAAVLGLSSRGTALDVYLEKRAEKPHDDTMDNAQLFGILLEPVLRDVYNQRHPGALVQKPEHMLRHPKHGFIVGNPDGLAAGAKRGWEGKTARTDRGWGEPGSDQIPQEYLIQCQHYMVLTLLPVWDVSVLIGGQDYREYEVPADRELHEMLVDAEADFWQRVQRGEPPDPDWESPHTLAAVRRLYRGTNGESIPATPQHEHWRAVMEDAAEMESKMKAVAEGAKARLLYDMGDAAKLTFADGKCLRRKLTKRKGYTVADSEYMDARLVNAKE